MTIYDAIMAGLVVAGMIWGAIRGITWQVASIASLVLGYLVAFPMSGQIAPQFPGEPIVARTLAMLAIYVVVSGGVFGAAWLIRTTLRRLKFEAYDRHLGMLLGGAEGAFLGIVGTLFVLSLAPQSRQPILTSPAGKVVSGLLNVAQPALPTEVRSVLAPFWNSAASDSYTQADAPAWPKRTSSPGMGSEDSQVVRSWLTEERSRVSRAVGQAVQDQLDSLGNSDGRATTFRR